MAKKTTKKANDYRAQPDEKDYIFRPKSVAKKTKQVSDESLDLDEIYYNYSGNQVPSNDKDIVAKKIKSKYFIVIGPNGTPYNPRGMYDNGTLHKQRNGKRMWDFLPVRKVSFELYIKFLVEKNMAHFNNLLRNM